MDAGRSTTDWPEEVRSSEAMRSGTVAMSDKTLSAGTGRASK